MCSSELDANELGKTEVQEMFNSQILHQKNANNNKKTRVN